MSKIALRLIFQVRQMFDERRQQVVRGIDKSYPLQPITTRPMPNAVSRPVKATTVMKLLVKFVLVGIRWEHAAVTYFLFFLSFFQLRSCNDLCHLHALQIRWPYHVAYIFHLFYYSLCEFISDVNRKTVCCQFKSQRLFQLYGKTTTWLQWR